MAKHTSTSPFAKIRTSKIGTITIEQNKMMGTPCAHLFSAKPEDSFIVDPQDSLDSWTQLVEACPRVADGKNRDRITLNQPLSITWVMESYSGKEIPIIRSIRETPSVATNATFPTWCKSVEELGNWLREMRAGDVWAGEVLGANPAQWPSKEECERKIAVAAAANLAKAPKPTTDPISATNNAAELAEFNAQFPKKEKPMPDQTMSDLEVVAPAADVDELAPDEPKHWSADPKWRAQLNDIKSAFPFTARMSSKEWEDYAHKAVGVETFKDLAWDQGNITLQQIEQQVEKDASAAEDALETIKAQIRAALSPLGNVTLQMVADAIGYGGNVSKALAAGESAAGLVNLCQEYVATKNTQETPVVDAPATVAPSEAQNATAAKIEAETMPNLEVSATPVIDASPVALTTIPNTGLATLPMVAQWDIMRQQASVLIKSGFMPQSIKTPEQAITIMMMGSALHIDPIVALNNINVIQGKPTVSPQLMLALVRRSGQLESFTASDDGQTCTVVMKRRGEPAHTETFSQQDAAAMGLAGKDNWRKQPATMRKWRAIAAACRVVFPDVTWGIASYTTEEINPDLTIDYAA